MSFIDETIIKAKSKKMTIVLPESEDLRILEAANNIIKDDIADILLIGDENEIIKVANENAFNYIEKAKIIAVDDEQYKSMFIDSLCEIRKHRKLSREDATKHLNNPLYFGVMLVKHGYADGMVAGATHTSGETLLPAVKIIDKVADCKKVSSYFIMVTNNKKIGYNGNLVLADCALLAEPNYEQLSEIAILAAKSFLEFFEVTPKTAFLSYSTKGSAKSAGITKIRKALELSRKTKPTMIFDGEFQIDAAIIPEVNRLKAPDSVIKGDANILIFPDVNSGNLVYKTIERFGNAQAYGPITQGLIKPVNDLSRGCSVNDIIGLVAITAVQAQKIVES